MDEDETNEDLLTPVPEPQEESTQMDANDYLQIAKQGDIQNNKKPSIQTPENLQNKDVDASEMDKEEETIELEDYFTEMDTVTDAKLEEMRKNLRAFPDWDKDMEMVEYDGGEGYSFRFDEEMEGENERAPLKEDELNMIEDFNKELDKDECEESLVVLGPDHPKMARFQQAFKAHLERQLYLAECEMKEIENEKRMQKKAREDLGNSLFNLQYELSKQNENMSAYDSKLIKLDETKKNLETETEELREMLNSEKQKLVSEAETEKELMASVRDIDMTEWCIREAASIFDGERKTRQLVDEKINKLKTQIEKDKRDQDFYLDKLLQHVQRLEGSNCGLERQIQAHLEEQKDLGNFIREAGIEIEALQIEKLQLQKAWQETIGVIRTRDEALASIRKLVTDYKEGNLNLSAEIRSVQKEMEKEQEFCEEQTMLCKRRRLEERHLNTQFEFMIEKNTQMRHEVSMLQRMKSQLEAQLLRANYILGRKEKEGIPNRKKYEILSNEKHALEDAILTMIQHQTTLNKASFHMSEKVKEARKISRKMDSEAAKVENELSKVVIYVENLKGILMSRNMQLEDLQKKLLEQENLIQKQAKELKISDRNFQRKTSELETVHRQLRKITGIYGKDGEQNDLEREIEELEQDIEKHKAKAVQLQDEWLHKQDDLVTLTVKREELNKGNDLLRKEIFIMDRKKARLDEELNSTQREMRSLKKTADCLMFDIEVSNAKLNDDKINYNRLDRDNLLQQNELIYLLKEAEQESVELNAEIDCLEETNRKLKDFLREGHSLCLFWERKVRISKELKTSLKKEQEGSTSDLKLAIHHMQVRFHELMRAQEKLLSDLERSIERRDRIIQQADLKLKRGNIHPKLTKLNIIRNFDQMKERNKGIIKEAYDAEMGIKDMEREMKYMESRHKCEEETLFKMREIIKTTEQKINEITLLKHKNFIELLLRQLRYKVLEAIKFHRYNPLYRYPEQIDKELKAFEKKCYVIVELCDILIHEFPDLVHKVKLIKSTILPSIK